MIWEISIPTAPSIVSLFFNSSTNSPTLAIWAFPSNFLSVVDAISFPKFKSTYILGDNFTFTPV